MASDFAHSLFERVRKHKQSRGDKLDEDTIQMQGSSSIKSKLSQQTKKQRGLYESRRLASVVLFSWLLLNADPIYLQRVLGSMAASRLLNRSLQKFAGKMVTDTTNGRTSGGGMSAVEAVALIHAMNSGNNKGSQNLDLTTLLGSSSQQKQARQPASGLTSLIRQDTALNRQLPVPVPAPVPVTPIVAVVAAIAAFAAAALAGLTPFAAVVAALVAFVAALVAALLALVVLVKPVANPIVKKLVIKKTVLPFVIPIPYKKKEKEIIYKYIPKPYHYKHQHHGHEEHKYEEHKYKHKYKHKKIDTQMELDNPLTGQSPNQLDKIQTLMSEQDQIQDLIDEVESSKPPTSTVPIITERS